MLTVLLCHSCWLRCDPFKSFVIQHWMSLLIIYYFFVLKSYCCCQLLLAMVARVECIDQLEAVFLTSDALRSGITKFVVMTVISSTPWQAWPWYCGHVVIVTSLLYVCVLKAICKICQWVKQFSNSILWNTDCFWYYFDPLSSAWFVWIWCASALCSLTDASSLSLSVSVSREPILVKQHETSLILNQL